MKKLKTVDLFAGAGGLSLGFLKTGWFDIKVAVEYDKHAAKTYAENHEGVEILQKDASTIFFKQEIEDKHGKIDVVIGGPPCQGFSNANRQKSNLISGNNQLVQQYVRALEELNPTAFVLENVKTLESSKHFFFVATDNAEEVQILRIPTKKEKVALCSGEKAMALVAEVIRHKDPIDKFRMAEEGYAVLCTLLKFSRTEKRAIKYVEKQKEKLQKLLENWDNFHHDFWNQGWEFFYHDTKEIVREFANEGQNYLDYFDRLKTLVEVEQAFERVYELKENHIDFEVQFSESRIYATVETFTIKDYLEHKFAELGYETKKAILNAADFGVPQTRERFIMIGIKKECIEENEIKLPTPIFEEKDYFTVRDAIENLENMETSIHISAPPVVASFASGSKLATLLNNKDLIANHVVTDTGDDAMERFKALGQGENFHKLDKSLKTTYSLPERTQNTIYLRLRYDKPSGTVLNVRKSMWIHPMLDRALSIREAARLQSFPDSFVFHGSKNSQYQQVGNAVPPLLGQAIAECLLEQLGFRSYSSLLEDFGINECAFEDVLFVKTGDTIAI
ncbi:DNA cytosine methyltransferase [Paenibacillus sp. S150]|uniref:DNA cytosine methyltransferase n=1 Tax=Paenibacillus sp. S150 TaxID=2749826 RepID=UPI001C5A485A|nr:DNA cytosine methyltransferase [Paenibacillus sp. S150]MBW4081273.1 DNA cytosine methyltransferase [Paenibacillus sp. S150]